MQIVINISHNLYESIIKDYALSKLGDHELYKAAQKGAPLPAHHGNLYDFNDIKALCVKYRLASIMGKPLVVTKSLGYASITEPLEEFLPVIIPATEEGEENDK